MANLDNSTKEQSSRFKIQNKREICRKKQTSNSEFKLRIWYLFRNLKFGLGTYFIVCSLIFGFQPCFAATINYPNPFNPNGGEVCTIECASTPTVESTLYIYDMSARLILRKNFSLPGGSTNQTTWNGYGDNNELAGSNIYLYQIIDSNHNRIGKGKIWVINR